MIVSVNGVLTDGSAALSAADRGFLLGDGVFETILVRSGAPIFLAAHLQRLQLGLRALGIAEPTTLVDVQAHIRDVAACNGCGQGDAAARITISRGSGPRGLLPSSSSRPTLVVSVEKLASRSDAALRLVVTHRRRLASSSFAGFKAIGGYVENMLARADSAAAGADDGLVRNEFGRVVSASAANLFLIGADGVLRTPACAEGALPGIVRGVVLSAAATLGRRVQEGKVEEADLDGAELFLTNSLVGIRRALLLGAPDHPPSDIFRALEACYARRIDAEAGAVP